MLILAAQVEAGEASVLKTSKDRLSYTIGVDVARSLKRLGAEPDLDLLVKGLRDDLAGEKLLMSEEDLRATLTAYYQELRQKAVDARMQAAEQNKKEGDAFLAENKTKEGVVVLPSGLQYRILKVGDGRKPTNADTVECHYRGAFINGTEFDSSYKRTGKPATFKVTGVIPGWTEALQLMPAGSKWQLFIPPQLAYGEEGSGKLIGPNTTLIFDVELLSIQ